uniref:LIM zinc-binding domain-containing protein n=1 Tax=Nippostrongylus brasiliensis TaxID=27835 RepID=A0A158R327_NIPBR
LFQIFHINCFKCKTCSKKLAGSSFYNIDNRPTCKPCYEVCVPKNIFLFHSSLRSHWRLSETKFAPRCAVCNKPIVPKEGEKESVRVIAMDKSFHPSCYKCEDCGMQLSSKVEGAACYPLNSHLYCKTCNGNRLRAQAAA